MKKINKIIIATLGGIDVVFYLATPILLILLWINVFGFRVLADYLICGVGLFSSFFRAIKVGWLNNE